MHGRGEKWVQNFDWKPEGKGLLGRPRRRRDDNVRMDVRGTGWEGVDWIYLAQDRDQWRDLVNTVMNLGSITGEEFLD
jgi:hypothetical protein